MPKHEEQCHFHIAVLTSQSFLNSPASYLMAFGDALSTKKTIKRCPLQTTLAFFALQTSHSEATRTAPSLLIFPSANFLQPQSHTAGSHGGQLHAARPLTPLGPPSGETHAASLASSGPRPSSASSPGTPACPDASRPDPHRDGRPKSPACSGRRGDEARPGEPPGWAPPLPARSHAARRRAGARTGTGRPLSPRTPPVTALPRGKALSSRRLLPSRPVPPAARRCPPAQVPVKVVQGRGGPAAAAAPRPQGQPQEDEQERGERGGTGPGRRHAGGGGCRGCHGRGWGRAGPGRRTRLPRDVRRHRRPAVRHVTPVRPFPGHVTAVMCGRGAHVTRPFPCRALGGASRCRPSPLPPPPHLTAVHVLGAPTDRVTPPREGARPRARGRVAVGRRGLSVRPSVRPSGPGRVRNGRQRPPRALPPPPPGRAADLLPAHGEAGGPGLAARRIPPVRCAGARGRAAARLGCRRGSAGDGSSRFGSAGLGRGGLPAPLGAAAGPCAVPAAGWRSGVRRLAPWRALEWHGGWSERGAAWEELKGVLNKWLKSVPWSLGRDQKTEPVRDGGWGGDGSNVVGCIARITAAAGKLACCGDDPVPNGGQEGRLAQGSSLIRGKWKRCCLKPLSLLDYWEEPAGPELVQQTTYRISQIQVECLRFKRGTWCLIFMKLQLRSKAPLRVGRGIKVATVKEK